MISPKLALIKAITLLCLEHRVDGDKTPTQALIGDVLDTLPKEDAAVELDSGRLAYTELKALVFGLVNMRVEDFPHEKEITQQVKIIVREDTFLYEALYETLEEVSVSDVDGIAELAKSLRKSLAYFIREHNLHSIANEYFTKIKFKRNEIPDLGEFILEMGERFSPYIGSSGFDDPDIMSEVNFNDVDSMNSMMDKARNTLSSEGALLPGWQALREMLGAVQGFRRGELVTIGALQYNFKSGIMLCLLVHFLLLNKPVLRDPTKKPAIVFISFENELPGNMRIIYEYIYENETGVPADLSKVSNDEIVEYVMTRFERSGFHVKMLRIDPTGFTCPRLIQYLESLQREGFEIISLMIDYLNMMSKAGLETTGVAGDDIRLLFRRLRNYASPRGITVVTPHQLSSDALSLARENVEDFVKAVANKGYYDGCRRLGQEMDLELFIHIVRKSGDKAYLTIQRGKHRDVNKTPQSALHITLPFFECGTIPMDIGKANLAVNLNDGGFDMDGGSLL